jgi:hypothetical protein
MKEFKVVTKINNQEVMKLGMQKEFKDVFGPGSAEAEGSAKTAVECLSQCDL